MSSFRNALTARIWRTERTIVVPSRARVVRRTTAESLFTTSALSSIWWFSRSPRLVCPTSSVKVSRRSMSGGLSSALSVGGLPSPRTVSSRLHVRRPLGGGGPSGIAARERQRVGTEASYAWPESLPSPATWIRRTAMGEADVSARWGMAPWALDFSHVGPPAADGVHPPPPSGERVRKVGVAAGLAVVGDHSGAAGAHVLAVE